ncbi:MAG: hypothetical protein ACYTDW_00760 [Planctomycetota bacterium]|jgi:hypothetical protein
MKKLLLFVIAFFVLFAGCTKHEPDPVIVNISDDEKVSSEVPELFTIDVNNPEASDTEFPIIDEKSLLETGEEVEKKPDVIFVPTPNDVPWLR